jgi:hypothetical protein
METALYFPYLRVPESAWFTQILLYWDRAATIAPYAITNDETLLGTYVRNLNRAGLLSFVQPDDSLWRVSEEFVTAFLRSIDAQNESTDQRRRSEFKRLHTGKMGYQIFRELEHRGLARADDTRERDSWWMIEESTADQYMAYLAAVLCGLHADGFMCPVTDTETSVGTFAFPSGDLESRMRYLRYQTILRALPAPSEPVDVDEVLRFKEKWGGSLSRLRRHLDLRLVDIAALDDPEVRKVKSDLVAEELADEVALLRENMEKRRWPKVLLVGIGGVVASALGLAAGVATGGMGPLALGLTVGSGVLSTGGAAAGAVDAARAPRLDRNHPLAYAALAPT